MEINGKIVQILPEQSGEGKNGTWRKKEFILETQDKYPKKVCITVWGDKIDEINASEGELVTAHVNIESREFKGRWYTDVKAWKLTNSQNNTSSPGDNIESSEESYDGEEPPF